MCNKLILDDIMVDARSTRSLMKLDVTDKTIQKMTPNLGFGLKSDFKNLKAAKKVTVSDALNFLLKVNKFVSSLCNHLLGLYPSFSGDLRFNEGLSFVAIGYKLMCVGTLTLGAAGSRASHPFGYVRELRFSNILSMHHSVT